MVEALPSYKPFLAAVVNAYDCAMGENSGKEETVYSLKVNETELHEQV